MHPGPAACHKITQPPMNVEQNIHVCSPTADTRSYWTPFIFTKDASTDNSQATLIKTSTSFIRVTSDGACFVPGAWMSGLNLTSNSEIRKKPHVSQKLQNIKTHAVKSSLRNSLKF